VEQISLSHGENRSSILLGSANDPFEIIDSFVGPQQHLCERTVSLSNSLLSKVENIFLKQRLGAFDVQFRDAAVGGAWHGASRRNDDASSGFRE
jgi:hypothetical protein